MQIILIQDDIRLTSALIDMLRRAGYEAEHIPSAPAALPVGRVDIALLDTTPVEAGSRTFAQPQEAGKAPIVILTARVAQSDEALERARDLASGQAALFATVQKFIIARLGDHTLTPEQIAAAHQLSLRSLQRLFQIRGSAVASWIRNQRLDRCRRDLADPLLAVMSVSRIAAHWGFPDSAHFSRVFKQLYGISPSEFRRGAHAHPVQPTDLR